MDKYNNNFVNLDELNDINFAIGTSDTNSNLEDKIDINGNDNTIKVDLEKGNQIKSEDFIPKEELNRYDNGKMDEPIHITLVKFNNIEKRFISYCI